MKRPGSAEGGGMLASLGGGSKITGGPAVLKPLAPPPSYTPPQVRHSPFIVLFVLECVLTACLALLVLLFVFVLPVVLLEYGQRKTG